MWITSGASWGRVGWDSCGGGGGVGGGGGGEGGVVFLVGWRFILILVGVGVGGDVISVLWDDRLGLDDVFLIVLCDRLGLDDDLLIDFFLIIVEVVSVRR